MKATKKPDIPAGHEFLDPVIEYTEAVLPLMRIFPVVYTSRIKAIWTVMASKHAISDSLKILSFMVKHSIYTFIRHKKPTITLPECDVALVISSNKPGWQPAIDELSYRLKERGYTCAVIKGNTISIVGDVALNHEMEKSVELFSDITEYGGHRGENLYLLMKSNFIYLIMVIFILIRNYRLLNILLKNPIVFVEQLFNSQKRNKLADAVLKCIRPKLIVTNGDHAQYSAEFAISKYAQSAHKVWLYNEVGNIGYLPIVSDELWVCNETQAEFMRQNIKDKNKRIEVVGKLEIDFAMKADRAMTDEETRLNDAIKSNKALLFLSQYVSGMPIDVEPVTREVIRWLVEAAKALPDWYVIFKARPLHTNDVTPGLENTKDLSNFVAPVHDISFNRYLNWDNVKAVAAISSIGLYVAAGMGKHALKLNVSTSQLKESVIDDVAVGIDSPEELIQTLSDIGNGKMKMNVQLDNDPRYPFRGHSMDRIEKLCVERLVAEQS